MIDSIATYALDIFLKQGFYKVSMDEVSFGLGMSKKTIYKYFRSKDELVYSAFQQLKKRGLHMVNSIVENQELEPLQAISMLTRAISQLMNSISDQFYRDMSKYRRDLLADFLAFRQERVKSIAKIIIKGQKQGIFKSSINAELFVDLLIAAADKLINPDYAVENDYRLGDVADQVFEIIYNGMLVNPTEVKFYEK